VTDAQNRLEWLRAGKWFRALSPALQAHLVSLAVVRTIAADQPLFRRGDPPSGLFAVLEGSIRITAQAEDGREALLTLAEPPTWFGEISVFDGLARTHDAIAAVDSVVLQVPQQPLLAGLEANPHWWRELGLLMAGKLRLLFTAMEDATRSPPLVRVARRLVSIAEGYGDWHARTSRVIEVKQEQLANMLSLSRQTTNQQLKELEARGLIRVTYGEIEVLELDGLRSTR
jgi:CRP/FNR family transcriptional regulator, cyclic AMP receptor protein